MIKANYAAYFAPENAYLVIIGYKIQKVKPVVENLSAPGNEQIQLKCPTQLRERSFTQINFIDVPNAVQSEISLVNTLDLKWLIKTFSSSYCHLHTRWRL
jgi:hypothetical protein